MLAWKLASWKQTIIVPILPKLFYYSLALFPFQLQLQLQQIQSKRFLAIQCKKLAQNFLPLLLLKNLLFSSIWLTSSVQSCWALLVSTTTTTTTTTTTSWCFRVEFVEASIHFASRHFYCLLRSCFFMSYPFCSVQFSSVLFVHSKVYVSFSYYLPYFAHTQLLEDSTFLALIGARRNFCLKTS